VNELKAETLTWSISRLPHTMQLRKGYYKLRKLNRLNEIYPNTYLKKLYLAEPADDNSNPFGYSNIDNCINNTLSGTPVAYGIDLAKYTDWTVITGLNENGEVCYFDRFQKDWSQTLATVSRIVGNTPAYVDSTGVGDPIVEQLQRNHQELKVQITSQSKTTTNRGFSSSSSANANKIPERDNRR